MSIYHGYFESEEKIALRAEMRKAKQIVNDCKSQMDNFLNTIKICIAVPEFVLDESSLLDVERMEQHKDWLDYQDTINTI
jgi:hypothetical protein